MSEYKARAAVIAAAAVAVILLAVPAGGYVYFTLDLDGNYLNGRDTCHVSAGDTIVADLWLHGCSIPLYIWAVGFAENAGFLEYVDCEYYMPEEWTIYPPIPGSIISMVAYDFTFSNPIDVNPGLHAATVRYRAAVENTIAEVLYDGCWYETTTFCTFTCYCTGFTAVIEGTSGTEESSWGSIKSLSR